MALTHWWRRKSLFALRTKQVRHAKMGFHVVCGEGSCKWTGASQINGMIKLTL
jgi:hypothetical protein